MNSSFKIPAHIAVTLAAGSTASPFFYNVNIIQRLARKATTQMAPVFNPTVTLRSVTPTGTTGQYIAVAHIEGTVAYNPCGCAGRTLQQIVSEDVNIPIASTTAPTAITATVGTVTNKVKPKNCTTKSDLFESDFPLTLAVTTT